MHTEILQIWIRFLLSISKKCRCRIENNFCQFPKTFQHQPRDYFCRNILNLVDVKKIENNLLWSTEYLINTERFIVGKLKVIFFWKVRKNVKHLLKFYASNLYNIFLWMEHLIFFFQFKQSFNSRMQKIWKTEKNVSIFKYPQQIKYFEKV